jgi:hypothetical protein
MDLAMQLIFTPMIWRLLERRKEALARLPEVRRQLVRRSETADAPAG